MEFAGYWSQQHEGSGVQYYSAAMESMMEWDRTDATIVLYARWTQTVSIEDIIFTLNLVVDMPGTVPTVYTTQIKFGERFDLDMAIPQVKDHAGRSVEFQGFHIARGHNAHVLDHRLQGVWGSRLEVDEKDGSTVTTYTLRATTVDPEKDRSLHSDGVSPQLIIVLTSSIASVTLVGVLAFIMLNAKGARRTR
jgi:hypothetical protein